MNPFHAPLRTLFGVLGQNQYLGPLDKLSAIPLSAPSILSWETLQRQFDGITVAEWWRKAGGTEDVLERLLRPFCRAVQFTDVENFSAFNFLGWVHQTLYGLPSARLAGYSGARDELIFGPLARYLISRGAQIRTSTKLERLLYSEQERRITGFGLEGGETEAVPQWRRQASTALDLSATTARSALRTRSSWPAKVHRLFIAPWRIGKRSERQGFPQCFYPWRPVVRVRARRTCREKPGRSSRTPPA